MFPGEGSESFLFLALFALQQTKKVPELSQWWIFSKAVLRLFQMFEGIAEGLQLEGLETGSPECFFISFQCLPPPTTKGSLRGDSEGDGRSRSLQIEDLLLWPCFPLLLPECRGGPTRVKPRNDCRLWGTTLLCDYLSGEGWEQEGAI